MSQLELEQLKQANEALQARVTELEDTLSAIRSGEVDALIVDTDEGQKVYSLTSAETTYRILIEQMNEGAAILSQKGIVLYCNKRFSEMLDAPMESVIGGEFVQFLAGEHSEHIDEFRHGLTKRVQRHFTFPVPHNTDQPDKHYLFSLAPLVYNAGQDLFSTTAEAKTGALIVTDISDMKNLEQQLRDYQRNLEEKVEQRTRELAETNRELKASRQAALKMMEEALETSGKLQESEEKYRQLIEQSSDAIYLFHNNRFEIVNQKFCSLFSTSPAEATAPNFDFLAFVAEKDKPHVEQHLMVAEKSLPPGLTYEFVVSEDGKRTILEASVLSIKYKQGYAIQGVLRDITVRKELEEQLYQSQKMEAIGQLAGGVAHDFNNILTVINGYSEMLFVLAERNSVQFNGLQQIREAGSRASALTRQLLAFSRKQFLTPQLINLNDLITNLEKMLGRLIGENIDLVTYLAPDLAIIKADPGQIEQVIVNLVVNARDAMPKGGKLTIETDNINLDETTINKYHDMQAGNYVLMTISDNGLGMDKVTLSRIFEPFFTTKNKGKGTGLGLAMVYGIIKQSGGNIQVYSELDQGTVFKIYLPIVEEKFIGAKEKAEIHEKLSGSETILVVEDEEAILNLIEKVLKQSGYHLITAKDGHDALDKVQGFKGPIHLLLTDVVMPRLSGQDLSVEIRKRHPETKICFMSGYTDNAIVHHDILDEKINFIQKPFLPSFLRKKVREVLDRMAD